MAYKEKKTNKWVANIPYFENDKKKWKRKYGFKTKKLAEQFELDFQESLEIKEELMKNEIIMSKVFKEFLQNKKGVVRETTYDKNVSMIKMHIEPFLATKDLNTINHTTITNFRSNLQQKGLSNKRTNEVIKFLKEVINFANAIYDTNINPFKKIKPLQVEIKKEIDFYSFNEFMKFIDNVDDIIYYTFFWFLYFSGTRKGEALALSWNDIDFKNKTVKIDKNCVQRLKGIPFKITPPKNESSIRTIQLDDKTIGLLSELKLYYKNNYKSFNSNMFVFGHVKPLPETTIEKRFKKYTEISNIRKIRIHDLRHSHASLLINNGATIVLVSKRLGHSDVKMTLNTYSHLFKDKEDEIINLIDEIVASKSRQVDSL